MMVKVRELLLSLVGASLPFVAQAQPPAPAPAQTSTSAKVDPRIEIASKIPGTKPEDLHPTPVPNIYEVVRGSEIGYVTADGKYAFGGDLVDVATNEDLTEDHRREIRVAEIGAIPESQMLIFGPKDPKYTITVFTDVDCAYCRQLHSQIADYNRLGIRVRYLFYPRTGPNTESWTKAEQVWCSTDRNDALTRAKLGQPLKAKPCADNPVARTYALGQSFKLDGTPAIVTSSGDMVGGYMPPAQMLQALQQLKKP
jgi:thiol:disulfide interchange protein DsbC